MPTLRDVQISFSERFEQKQDVQPTIRAVLCDSAGLTSGSGSVFADSDALMVWYQPVGSSSPGQVRCVRLEPELGLGVIIGYAEGSNELEVLSDDPFLRGSVATRKYLSVNGRDFEPGGRLQMWLYTKAIVPLATLPGTAGGLTVDVTNGDYEAADGTRATFVGKLSFDISGSQPAGPNQHLLVGLYLDSANTLNSVDGSTVATGVDAPEPTWPAGAVRLSVVDLDDSQTSIDFDADISDRRLLYPYPGSGAILKSFINAKGDLITGTADDTPAILSVGTDGQHLIADSGQSEGIDWSNVVDLAGVADALIIDADGDTTISAPSDDQIDIEVGGSDIGTLESDGMHLTGTNDVFPQASTNGLNARFENLFGDDVPADTYQFTQRTFQVNDFTNDKAGFEDSQTTPYSFGGSPGGFSISVPASTAADSATFAHFLQLINSTTVASGTQVYVQWAEAAATKNTCDIIWGFRPFNGQTNDILLAEFRFWSAATAGSPGAGDNYWALRFKWLPVTYPDYPLRARMYYGTGVTYATTDGTAVGTETPFHMGQLYSDTITVTTAGNPAMFVAPVIVEGVTAFSISTTVVGHPSSFNTVRFSLFGQFNRMFIDEIIIA